MSTRDIAGRIERLEERVTILEQLPSRVDALTARVETLSVRIDDWRVEMHHEFSAVRAEMRQLDEKLVLLNQRSDAKMDQLIEQTNVHMRVLHEDVISRIATIGEGRGRKKKR
jgi:hypothetical protein